MPLPAGFLGVMGVTVRPMSSRELAPLKCREIWINGG
jgi:hypothetical protein